VDEGNQPLVAVSILSVEEVADAHQSVQIIDARPQRPFDTGHIPGAICLGWEDWCDSAPLSKTRILQKKGNWGVLRQASAGWYSEQLAACGLRSHKPIVVYADGPQSRGREGRIAWMLLYLGAEAVSLLDGGWQAWLQMRGEVERARANPSLGCFPVSFQERRRCTLAQLTKRWQTLSRPLAVDTRSAAEWLGETPGYLPRRGHIPGAVLIPFTTLFDARGRYVDRASYVGGLPPSAHQTDDIVAYCEVGVRASLFALLHEAYTGRLVSVFDGSLVEWALNSELSLQADPAR
jgi:thiosulfate/3-mercaptopyruvate sulfurtransferase